MNQKLERPESAGGTADAVSPMQPHKELAAGEILEAGPFLYLISRTGELRSKLQKIFREDWSALYAMAMLRAVYNCPLSEMEDCFNRSILRLLFPNVSLNRQSILELLCEVVQYRSYQYMADDAENRTLYLMLDGSWMLRDTGQPLPNRPGYPGKAYHLDQLNALYAFAAKEDGTIGMPIYFALYPGSDISRDRFAMTCQNLNKAKRLIAVGGREAAEDGLRAQLEEMELPYIVRLRRGNEEIKHLELTRLGTYPERIEVGGRSQHALSLRRGDHSCSVFLDLFVASRDSDLRARRSMIQQGGEDPWGFEMDHGLPLRYQNGVLGLEQVSEEEMQAGGSGTIGTLTLQTYGLNCSSQEVYRLYQLRQRMEQSLQVYDALLPQDVSYLAGKFVEDSWMFLNLLAGQMIAETQAQICRGQGELAMTPQALYGRLSGVHCLRLNGKWAVPSPDEKLDAMCRKFGFDPTDIGSLGIRSSDRMKGGGA